MNLVNSARRHTLEAWSDDFLIMENRALGYRVKFLIDTFSNNGITGIISWQGKAVFEDLQEVQNKKSMETEDGRKLIMAHRAIFTNPCTAEPWPGRIYAQKIAQGT